MKEQEVNNLIMMLDSSDMDSVKLAIEIIYGQFDNLTNWQRQKVETVFYSKVRCDMYMDEYFYWSDSSLQNGEQGRLHKK